MRGPGGWGRIILRCRRGGPESCSVGGNRARRGIRRRRWRACLEAGEREAAGDAEDGDARGFGGGASAFGILDDEAQGFFQLGIVLEIEAVEGEVVAFGIGLAGADIFDGDDGVEMVAELEGVEQAEDFIAVRARADGAGTLRVASQARSCARRGGVRRNRRAAGETGRAWRG